MILYLMSEKMTEEQLMQQFSFAFQPHYSKKYRVGDPNANKRHLVNVR